MDSLAYQYLVGGAVFVAGLAVAWRSGQIGWQPGRRRRRLVALCAGLLFFLGLQGALLLGG